MFCRSATLNLVSVCSEPVVPFQSSHLEDLCEEQFISLTHFVVTNGRESFSFSLADQFMFICNDRFLLSFRSTLCLLCQQEEGECSFAFQVVEMNSPIVSLLFLPHSLLIRSAKLLLDESFSSEEAFFSSDKNNSMNEFAQSKNSSSSSVATSVSSNVAEISLSTSADHKKLN